MAIQIDGLMRTMSNQNKTYKEISAQYKSLNKLGIASIFDTLSHILSKLSLSYKQMKRSMLEILAPLDDQLFFDMSIINSKLLNIKNIQSQLISNEKKLLDKKNFLFKQQDLQKWELPTGCEIAIDTLYNNREVALKEMLPKETNESARIRMMHGYLCNKIFEEFDRLCLIEQEKYSYTIVFVAKFCTDSIKDVYYK